MLFDHFLKQFESTFLPEMKVKDRVQKFFPLFPLVLVIWGMLLQPTLSSPGEIRQRSDGCGPHPLIALVSASRPYGYRGITMNEILRSLRADPEIWSEMKGLLRRYDDCIRAGDGLHYKRAGKSSNIETESETDIVGENEGGGEEILPVISEMKKSIYPFIYTGRVPAHFP